MEKHVRNIILASAALIILGCIAVVIYLGMRVAAPFIGSGSYKAEIERIRARHEPVSAADLTGDRIPDSENGAVLYASAFQGTKRPQLRRVSDDIASFLESRKRNNNPKLWITAADMVNGYDKQLKVIEAAASRPKCRFPTDWSRGFDVMFDHLDTFRLAQRLLHARALLDIKNGRTDAALHSAELALEMQHSLRDEPALINYLGRMQIIRRACAITIDMAQYGNLSEDQAKRLYDDLRRVNLNGSLSKALKGERAVSIIIYDRLRTRAGRMIAHQMGRQSDSTQSVLGRGVVNGWLGPDEAYYLKMMNERIEVADLPYRAIKSKQLNVVSRSKSPWYANVAGMLITDPERAAASRDSAIAEIAAARIILALHAYHNQHRSYPISLGELRRTIAWRLDADPFSGKDFIYKRKGQGFILYSIGPDLNDDGGKDPRKSGYIGPAWGGPRDIVWEFSR